MKKNIFILFFTFWGALHIQAQNWLFYTTDNSGSFHNFYSRMAIDTANTKWFDWVDPGGDKTICFDNDSSWQMITNYHLGTTFNCDILKADKHSVLWYITSGYKTYSLTNGISGSWNFYDGLSTGISSMDGVFDVAVDNYNNKYFATRSGLIKYDNNVFTLMDTAQTHLPFERLARIAIDNHNNIWVTGGTNGLAKYNGTSWEVFTMPVPANQAYKLTVDSRGNVWLGRWTSGGGMYKFDGTTWTNYNTGNSGIPTNVISVITVDKNNVIWTTATGILSRFDGTTWTNYTASDGYPSAGNAATIQVDRYNNKWICASDGVVVFNETGVVGINEINQQMATLNLYPNPAKENVTLTIQATQSENAILSIINSAGQSIRPTETRKLEQGKNEVQVEVNDLPVGIYFIRIKSAKGMITKKFVKQ